MTLEEYIHNPMGTSVVFTANMREAARSDYSKKFNELILKVNGRLDHFFYENKNAHKYYAHFKIPSSHRNLDYDVVFEFSENEATKNSPNKNLFEYDVKFFCNDPAFTYTYANAFARNNLFITQLKRKMSKTALRTAAIHRNSTSSVGYVKNIYFAFLEMQRNNFNRLDNFIALSQPYNLTRMLNQIEDTDTLLQKIKDLDAEEREKKAEKNAGKVTTSKSLQVKKDEADKILGVKKSGFVRKVKTSNVIKPRSKKR